jgi:hypothetical protein
VNHPGTGGNLSDFDASQIDWRDPWRAIAPEYALVAEAELKRELSSNQILSGQPARAIGHRSDSDTILFLLGGTPPRFAVVHLTFRKEIWSTYPVTRLFDSIDDWINRCMLPDAGEYR